MGLCILFQGLLVKTAWICPKVQTSTARWVSFCTEYHYQPLFFIQQSHAPFSEVSGIFTCTKHPQPHPNTTLFLPWIWKWAKWMTIWAAWTPIGQNDWKVDKTFLEVGKINYSLAYADTITVRGGNAYGKWWIPSVLGADCIKGICCLLRAKRTNHTIWLVKNSSMY